MTSLRSILTFCGTLIVAILSAQTAIGVRGGFTLSRMELRTSSPNIFTQHFVDRMTWSYGSAIAVPIELGISKHWAVQPEIGVCTKGMAFADTTGYKEDYRMNYGDITVLVKGMIPFGDWRAELFAGPSFSLGLSMRYVATSNDPLVNNTDVLVDINDTDLQNAGLSGTVGAGVAYHRGVPTFFINYRYVHGLSDAFNEGIRITDADGSTIATMNGKHRGSVISLGMLVPLSSAGINNSRTLSSRARRRD